jgi:uncharacterized protein YdeI (YjbR/CyaY-like superfamily)
MARDAVASHIATLQSWKAETHRLDGILRTFPLTPAIKWGKPCYGVDRGGNVAIIQGFKDACALMFFQGALLDDPRRLLEAPGEHSQSARRLMFASVADVDAREADIRAFTAAAIALDVAGARVEKTARTDLDLPAELTARLKKDRALAAAWQALTPGRRRAWVMHIAGAKQEATREARIDKATPSILAGRGLNDRPVSRPT